MLYTIKKMSEGAGAYVFGDTFDPQNLAGEWASLDKAHIADNEWIEQYPDKFDAWAVCGWNSKGINVLMYAYENPILANARGWEGSPCKDSCLEFFFIPFPEKDSRYLNVEVNPVCAVCSATGEGRHNRVRITEHVNGMVINTKVHPDVWAVSYNIPMEHIKALYGDVLSEGCAMKGNFYTCSEDIHPHFATWNYVVAPKPDFHRPECFGDIVLG